MVVEAKDGQNNVATKTYSVTTTGVSKRYEYDANGNLRYEKLPNGSVVREYRWDQQNRLVRVLEGAHESVYEYDGESHRTRIKELVSSSETKNETFVWWVQDLSEAGVEWVDGKPELLRGRISKRGLPTTSTRGITSEA